MGHITLVFQHRGLQSALFRQPLLTLIIHNLLVFIIDAQSFFFEYAFVNLLLVSFARYLFYGVILSHLNFRR